MEIEDFSQEIRIPLEGALKQLKSNEDVLEFWEVSDYGIFVVMSESFYKTLNFRKGDPNKFIENKLAGDLPHTGEYADSRTYVKVILDHFSEQELKPQILDVGGYIGRFSLESALLIKSGELNIPIHCFEPGLTRGIIEANLNINQVSELVEIHAEAASAEESIVEYRYTPNALISGRICHYPGATMRHNVKTVRLDKFLDNAGCSDAAIIKVDTEGHEPDVLSGLGNKVKELPMVVIPEFWPATLDSMVNDNSYADFVAENFHVFNIRSSLYPSYFKAIDDIQEFGREIELDVKESNIDLLFISKVVKNTEGLITKLNQVLNNN